MVPEGAALNLINCFKWLSVGSEDYDSVGVESEMQPINFEKAWK